MASEELAAKALKAHVIQDFPSLETHLCDKLENGSSYNQ